MSVLVRAGSQSQGARAVVGDSTGLRPGWEAGAGGGGAVQ